MENVFVIKIMVIILYLLVQINAIKKVKFQKIYIMIQIQNHINYVIKLVEVVIKVETI